MSDFSVRSQKALHNTAILISAALAMIFIWSCFRMPEGNLLIVVFAFLSAVRIAGFAVGKIRLKVLADMVIPTAILQYIVSTTNNIQLLNILLPVAAGYIILRKLPPASAYPVLLTGFQAYSAIPGCYAAAERSIDIFIAGATAWCVALPISGKNQLKHRNYPEELLTMREAFVESFIIFCAVFLYKILYMPQGLWIILTVIFIYIARQPGISGSDLVRQRIFAVPIGILLGGIYSCSAVVFDYRLAYLAPGIGAVGFFMLYSRHDFFSFSLFFMTAFTVCADWMTGTYREFNFLQLLFARSLATVIGAVILLTVEKSFANLFPEVPLHEKDF